MHADGEGSGRGRAGHCLSRSSRSEERGGPLRWRDDEEEECLKGEAEGGGCGRRKEEGGEDGVVVSLQYKRVLFS